MISAIFNYTDTEVTDNEKGLLNDRRMAEFAYALPRIRWNVGLTQQVGRVSIIGRLNYCGGWYDYDSGFAEVYLPSGGIEQGFFDGKPIVDLEGSIDLVGGATLAVGTQNAFNTYPDESARVKSRFVCKSGGSSSPSARLHGRPPVSGGVRGRGNAGRPRRVWSLSATAVMSLRALARSGKAPAALILRLISPCSRSRLLVVRSRGQCASGNA